MTYYPITIDVAIHLPVKSWELIGARKHNKLLLNRRRRAIRELADLIERLLTHHGPPRGEWPAQDPKAPYTDPTEAYVDLRWSPQKPFDDPTQFFAVTFDPFQTGFSHEREFSVLAYVLSPLKAAEVFDEFRAAIIGADLCLKFCEVWHAHIKQFEGVDGGAGAFTDSTKPKVEYFEIWGRRNWGRGLVRISRNAKEELESWVTSK